VPFYHPSTMVSQQGITKIYHTILKYNKHSYVRNAMNISLNNPTGFVVVWSTILKLYGADLSFGSPNFNFNCYVIILLLKPPFSNTSFIVFFPICTWITTIWLSITTTVVPTSSTKKPTCLFVVTLLTLWVFSSFSFGQRYLFSLELF
jgi:hypothetical protein